MNKKSLQIYRFFLLNHLLLNKFLIKQFLLDLGISDITCIETGVETILSLERSPLIQKVIKKQSPFLCSRAIKIKIVLQLQHTGISAVLDKPFEPTSIRRIIMQFLNQIYYSDSLLCRQMTYFIYICITANKI